LITIYLPGLVKGKGRPRIAIGRAVAGKKIRQWNYTPEATRSYEAALKQVAVIAMAGKKPLSGPLSVSIEAVYEIPKSWTKAKREATLSGAMWKTSKPDLDNIMKMKDALNGVVWLDDSQVVHSNKLLKRYGYPAGLTITVREA
jgi:Holliday junction resolvase RusA-like endonuclease